MLDGIKSHWNDLKRGKPGSRFQDHYKKRHEKQSSPWRKTLFLGGGALIIAAGIFFLPAPGPGFLIIFLGGGLMAQESRHAARVLDWCEKRVRAIAEWALGVWNREYSGAGGDCDDGGDCCGGCGLFRVYDVPEVATLTVTLTLTLTLPPLSQDTRFE